MCCKTYINSSENRMTSDICSNINGVDPNQLASQQDPHHFLNNVQVCVHNQTMDSELFENQTIAYQFILTACYTIVNVITAFLYA